jgi:hypothetical protein
MKKKRYQTLLAPQHFFYRNHVDKYFKQAVDIPVNVKIDESFKHSFGKKFLDKLAAAAANEDEPLAKAESARPPVG